MEDTRLYMDRLEKLKQIKQEAMSFHYQIEDQITDAISAGDIQELTALLNTIIQNKEMYPLARTEGESLRDIKNTLVICNTYSRIAAKNGGLDPLYIHLISERYTSLIEEAPDIEYLEDYVFSNMFMEYCEAVQQFSTNTYSSVMKEIVSYISDNLTSDMTLTSVATLFGIHPVHLARKFKQETGNTFIGFVNLQRVSLAKYYFHCGNLQMSEVADLSGFNSHSYFTKVFKKLTGITPTEYIRVLPSVEN